MNKNNHSPSNVVMYMALAVLAILEIPILFAIIVGVIKDFGFLWLLAGIAGIISGIWLITFLFKKIFRLHIRSWFSFALWFFLTILMGVIICSLFNGELAFKEMLSWGGRSVPSSRGRILILPIAWIVLFGLAFQKSPAGRPAKNALEAEQNTIDELYDKAFMQNDFDALCELVNSFCEGDNQKFFQKSPIQATKVFEGAQHLVQLVEEGNEKQPELEDYYWLGLMYETGFAYPPDPLKAIEYYTKALSTKTCWDRDPDNFKNLCKKVQKRIEHLRTPN